jgi:hypothetical protein
MRPSIPLMNHSYTEYVKPYTDLQNWATINLGPHEKNELILNQSKVTKDKNPYYNMK